MVCLEVLEGVLVVLEVELLCVVALFVVAVLLLLVVPEEDHAVVRAEVGLEEAEVVVEDERTKRHLPPLPWTQRWTSITHMEPPQKRI